MKGTKILDSSALLAYFEGEAGGLKVREFLKEAAEKGEDLLISVINWGEILYIVEGRLGIERKNEVEQLMHQMHLEIVDLDQTLTREAAHLKASIKLPYVDCFVAALSFQRKGILVTGDKDFKPLEGRLSILWI